MDPVKIELVGHGRYAVAPLIAIAGALLEVTRVSFEQHMVQGLGADL